MNTPSQLLLTACAVVLVASACSSPDIAATVNNSEISESLVLGLRHSYENQLTVSGETFRNDLSRLIFTEAMLTAASTDFGLTDLDSESARDAYLSTMSIPDQQYLSSVSQNEDFTDAILDIAVTQLIVRSEVRSALAHDQANIESVWENQQAGLTQVCVRHILTATETELEAVLVRLDAGETFAAVANEVSLDQGSVGGVLPCPFPLSQYVGPFGFAIVNAPIGELVGPFQTEFGWHVLVVDSLEFPATLDELAQDPLRWMTPDMIDVFWAPWLNAVVEKSDIKVRSDIGMWYPPVDGILPPRASP